MRELEEFLDLIWGETEGYVYSPSRQGEVWKKHFFRWPENKVHVVSHILARSASKWDVFISPVIWSKTELTKKSIKCTNVLWADFDSERPIPWDSSVEPPDGRPGTVPGPPSVVVQSSTEGHEHVYWRLNEPCTDVSEIESINRAIAYTYGADYSGWDADQLLRPPNTTNYKHSLPVTTLNAEATSYSISGFKGFAPIKELLADDIGDLPAANITEVLAKYKWDADSIELLTGKDIPQGSRSGALMKIGYRCAEIGLSDDEAYCVLLHVDDTIGKFKHRNDRKRRLLDILNKARLKYPSPVAEFTAQSLQPEVDRKTVYGFGDFLAADLQVDWAIKEVLPVGGLGIISSAPGVGKTQFLTQLGIHHALGKQFVGWDFERPATGMFLSLEMGAHGYHRLVSTVEPGLSTEDKEVLNQQFLVVPSGEPLDLSNTQAREFLQEMLEEHKPDFILIDSLQKVITGKISDDDVVRNFFNYLASLRQRYGFYCWLVHHNRKAQTDNKKPKSLDDIYGSVYISAEPDTILSLWKESPSSQNIEVNFVKNRFAETPAPYWIHRTEHLNFELGKVDEGDRMVENLLDSGAGRGQTIDPSVFE